MEMRPITKTVYAAFDGTTFDSAADCRAWEKSMAHMAIVGLTPEEARAIASREDAERAEAVEFLGKQIEKARLAAGDLRRRPAQPSEPETSEAPLSSQQIPITPAGRPLPPAEEADDEARTEALDLAG
jgi:hypothetical protein